MDFERSSAHEATRSRSGCCCRETIAEQDVLIRRAAAAGHRLTFPATPSGEELLVVGDELPAVSTRELPRHAQEA